MLEDRIACARHLVAYLEEQLAVERKKLAALTARDAQPKQLGLDGKPEEPKSLTSEALRLWDDLEFWRQERCRELGLPTGLANRPHPGKLNTLLVKVWEATGLKDELVSGRSFSRASQLGSVFQCYLVEDFGRIDERNSTPRDPPWPIELFLSPGVCGRLARMWRADEIQPWRPAELLAHDPNGGAA